MNNCAEAYSDAHRNDPVYESDRMALIACALDPETWVLEESVSENLATRVREHLRGLFMAEFNKNVPQAAPPAEGLSFFVLLSSCLILSVCI